MGMLMHGAPSDDSPTVGTVWNEETGQGVEALLARVQVEYDRCVVRVRLATGARGTSGTRAVHHVVRRLRRAIQKRGVGLEVSCGGRSREDLRRFLAGNTLNAIYQDAGTADGLRPLVEAAIAAGRPLALRRGPWADEILAGPLPPVFVERRSLRALAAGGLPAIRLEGGLWRLAAPVRRAVVGLFDSMRRTA